MASMKYSILIKLNILIAFSLLIITSCNKRKDYFLIENIDPIATNLSLHAGTGVINMDSESPEIKDTIKLSKTNNYKFTIELEDEVDYIEVKANQREGSGSHQVNSNYLESSIVLEAKTLTIKYTPSGSGTHVVDYEFIDIYGKVTIVRLNLFTFWNQKPVANFTFENTMLYDPNEYRIGTEGSYDPDKRFGGGLAEYEFNIGLFYTVTTPENYLRHIFNDPGTYAIKVRVKDNDGTWSDYKTNIIVID